MKTLQANGFGVSVPQVVITTLSGTRLLLISATCCSVIPGFRALVIEPFRVCVLPSQAATAAMQSKGYLAFIMFLPVNATRGRRRRLPRRRVQAVALPASAEAAVFPLEHRLAGLFLCERLETTALASMLAAKVHDGPPHHAQTAS